METYLAHHGILGMKWGIRRWQNADGSYNAAGKLRYGDGPKKNTRKAAVKTSQSSKSAAKKKTPSQAKKAPAQSAQPNQPKPVWEMTDQEIKDFMTRRKLEADYLEAITPKQQEKAESLTHKYMVQFGTKLADKIIQDAANQIGASIVKSILGGDKNNNKNENNEKKKEPGKKPDKKSSTELDREKARAQAIANDQAKYNLQRQKEADRIASRQAAQQARDERAAAWREREAKWKAEEDAWYADVQREIEERRRKNMLALPAGR